MATAPWRAGSDAHLHARWRQSRTAQRACDVVVEVGQLLIPQRGAQPLYAAFVVQVSRPRARWPARRYSKTSRSDVSQWLHPDRTLRHREHDQHRTALAVTMQCA
ncbi:hypothetical protein FQK02_18465 [Xanthomonas vasicola]|uniref:Uncharacterized protein n=1 Tax=Xanthomonas vasicola pv. vasculorum NCPPB 890 TaxID=1184265 RepID=A0A836P0L7_XANVA|nr:hypothetical protein FQK02_18465 [Xanthomonas vasicola]